MSKSRIQDPGATENLEREQAGQGVGSQGNRSQGCFRVWGLSLRWCHRNPGPVQWRGSHHPIWGEALQAGGAKTQRWKCGHVLEGRWGGGSGPIKAALGRALAVLPGVVGLGCGIDHTCVFQGHFGCLWEPDPEGAGWQEWRSQGQLAGHWCGPARGQRAASEEIGEVGRTQAGGGFGTCEGGGVRTHCRADCGVWHKEWP